MELIYIIDLAGTFVFAISGILTGIKKELDLFGAALIGGVTAIGGGTVRDVLIGNAPVSWMQDANYLIVIFAALPICYLLHPELRRLRRGIFLFDTIGIGLFTVIGVQKTLALGLSPAVAVLMGIASAVFGGIIRDVLTNEVPLILRKEIYAVACMVGGIAYLVLEKIQPNNLISVWVSIVLVVVIRYVSIKRNWSLFIKVPRA